MMVVMGMGLGGYMAGGARAGFVGGFQFQGCMTDAVFPEFLPNGHLGFVGVCIGDNMHSSAMG